MTTDWLGALLVGLIGAGHCMGMCGGIASVLSLGQKEHSKLVPIFYNLGRLLSYSFIGALVGGTVSTITQIGALNGALVWLRLAAALFMVLLACYIGRWWQGLVYIERWGKKLWRFISPAGQSLLPLKSPLHALPFGFVWGWLPCGLVYSTLTWSAVSGSALDGALIMFAFGLGTLPAMLMMGFGASSLHHIQKSKIFRNLGALLLLTYGLYTGYGALLLLSLI
ncbi:sulfite exporter TauE/SafE family protein [Vibrio ostreicida]|uniref:Sulfite exporter TauE/SafE family protein n=1 Tax=Vibrio ostreicida TaxID=526588 RepID=A0ABT8BTH3_9VIBR|nr:sulfite exporter TauE/SafE family protein [Vibrio ostreicida]MDN3609984.1 sulfite exporter TauE/SafE family protein [Vibrio ostreicida]NPD10409.1 sulfite exporter TauE/SafE family protein [Vibrio ostreicida]